MPPNTGQPNPRQRVVILGTGFAGLYVAKALEKRLKPSDRLEVMLINEENYFLYTPLLSEVAAGVVETRHILTPIRELCRHQTFLRAEVQAINLPERTLRLYWRTRDREETLAYDSLVIALGSTANRSLVPGVADFAIPFKTVADALRIRSQMIEMFEEAALEPDGQRRQAMLTFTVVGGGFSGIELAGALRDMAFEILRYYRNIDAHEVRIVVVEGGPRILAELPADLAAYAHQVLEKRGVELRTSAWTTAVLETGVQLKAPAAQQAGEMIPSRTVIWATGVAIEPLIACLPCAKDQRCRILVNDCLEVPDYPGVWALGDCALIPDTTQPGRFMPPTAQNAVQEATVVARNLLATHRNRPQEKRPLRYRPKGELVVLGHRNAVAVIRGHRFRGIPAWLLWRGVYLAKLPGWRKKIRVGMDWLIGAFSAPDITQVTPFQGENPNR